MIRNRVFLRAACGALALLPVVTLGAVDPPLSILGAADGQVKLLAETAQVSATITVESSATTGTTGTFRVSPLRDSAGHLFPVTLSAGAPSRLPAPSASAGGATAPVAAAGGGA